MGYKKYFAMSFDDGLEQDKKLIRLLKKYGVQCTFNLNGGLFGQRDYVARIGNIGFMDIPAEAKIRRALFKHSSHNRIPQDEIKQVYEGFEVASHAYKHEALAKLPFAEVKESLAKDVEILSQIVGYPITGHAYPGGFSSEDAAVCLQEMGFVYGREAFSSKTFAFPDNPMRFRPTCSHKDKNAMVLLEQFIAEKPVQDNLLFVMWGHGYEFDYGTALSSWNSIEKILQKISGKPDIEYCTVSRVFEVHNC